MFPAIRGRHRDIAHRRIERVTTRAAAALGLFALVVAEVLAVAVGWVATGMSVATGVDGFMVPNAIIALCCGLCGGLIATYRPDNRLGWLLLGAGICQAATAAVTPWLVQALATGAPARGGPRRTRPRGRGRSPCSSRWRCCRSPTCGRRDCWCRSSSATPFCRCCCSVPIPTPSPRSTSWTRPSEVGVYLALDWAGGGVLELVSAVVLSATYLAALVVLVLRFRRGTEQVRRQLLWLLLATAAAVALIAVTRLAGPVEDNGFPVILFTVVALVPRPWRSRCCATSCSTSGSSGRAR